MTLLRGKDFDNSVDQWLEDNPSWTGKVKRAGSALYHNKLPRQFRPLGVGHWFARTGLASSAPALAWFYGSIAAGTAAIAAGALFLAYSVVGLFDQISKAKTTETTDSRSELLVRFGDLLAALRNNSTLATNKDPAITACLGILENFARQITKSAKGEISVALCLYAGQSTTRMKVRHRNPGNERPINREFPTNSVLGHRACEAGPEPRVVHDLRWFGQAGATSPTQSVVNYRSIFIIPVSSKRSAAKGFISIDCKRPYAFYGNRANVIVVTCEPVISHICELI